MTRPAARRIAACLAAGLLTVLLTPFSFPAQADQGSSGAVPLKVTIDTLSPSTLPSKPKDTVNVSGTITNTSDSKWTNLQVYLLTSSTPMRSSEELAAASDSAPASEIGSRLYQPGLYDEVGDLSPGSSVDYALSVPRKDLQITGEPGVYWLGVHVLGGNEDGRDGVADGRARTFIPLMKAHGPSTSLSLVVPFRAKVHRRPDGRLADSIGWQHLLESDGRLGRLLALNASSTGMPVTWVVDPAVVDAARSVANDNPPMGIGPTVSEPSGNGTTQSPSPAPNASTSPSDGTTGQNPPAQPSEGARQAADWLAAFRRQAGQLAVMTVPYGDLDVASVLRGKFKALYNQANTLSTETMAGLDVTASPVVAPPSGFLPRAALDKVDQGTPVLLSDRADPDAYGPVIARPGAPKIVLTDSSAGEGGPAPTPRFGALAVRQRILSEAALHALSPDRDQPLVVSTPQRWDPGSEWRQADFFGGLDVGWLQGVGLPSSASGPPGANADDQGLVYPEAQRKAEIPFANILATQELIATGNAFAGLLTLNDTVDEFLAKSGLLASSNRARTHPNAALNTARATSGRIRRQMKKVTIDGPSFVTMSSGEGPIGVTLINNLTEPVTVGIKAETDGQDLTIHSPAPVRIGPGERASVRLRATSKDVGVHSLTLVPTNSDGIPLGSRTRFNVRSSQVGMVIWVIMGIGAVVLVIAAGTRIVKRIRVRKATHGPVLKGDQP